jgi:hypothetical protein
MEAAAGVAALSETVVFLNHFKDLPDPRQPGDLRPDFRTIDKLRDWLPIRREQCAKRGLRKSRW